MRLKSITKLHKRRCAAAFVQLWHYMYAYYIETICQMLPYNRVGQTMVQFHTWTTTIFGLCGPYHPSRDSRPKNLTTGSPYPHIVLQKQFLECTTNI